MASTWARRAERVLAPIRGQAGFTMIEVVVTALIVVIAVGGAVTALAVPQKQTFAAQRYAIAATLAEDDLNYLSGRAWADICTSGSISSLLSSQNLVVSGSPTNPDDFVGGSRGAQRLLILTNYKSIPSNGSGAYDPSSLIVPNTPTTGEQLVTGTSGSGSPNCVPATATISSDGVTGTLYRFVTYANESCLPSLGGSGGTLSTLLNQLVINTGLTQLLSAITSFLPSGGLNLLCSAPNNMKRITDVVVLSAPGDGAAPALPVYLSTLVPNPKAGIFAGSSSGLGISASCTITALLLVNCSASAN